jgi:hypothetical protein
MKISKLILSALNPLAWCRQVRRTIDAQSKLRYWETLNSSFFKYLRLHSLGEGRALLAEGMWDNPNQFLRLRIFIEGLQTDQKEILAAVLRRRTDRSLSTLKALGFSRFFFIEDFPVSEQDRECAKQLILRIDQDLLSSLRMPSGMPGYVIYDTVLKNLRVPQIELSSREFLSAMADALRMERFYDAIQQELELSAVVFSHPWKTEYAVMTWKALSSGVPFYHLNGMYETMRVRVINSERDFRLPIELCSYREFVSLPASEQEQLQFLGKQYQSVRGNADNTDINESMAFKGMQTGKALRSHLKLKSDAHVCLICGHAWFDFPHSFGMENFSDFVDWFQVTLSSIRDRTDVIWLLRPHPTESWYGGVRMKDLIGDLPPNIIFLEDEISTTAAQDLADSIVTVHGTVGMEAAARGKAVLCADFNPYQDWGFVTTATSREHYQELISNIEVLQSPSLAQTLDAAACLYLNIAPVDSTVGLLRLVGDHVDSRMLFKGLKEITRQKDVIEKQGMFVREWLASETKSFSVFYKMRVAKEISVGKRL